MTSHLKSPLVIALIICFTAPLMRCGGNGSEEVASRSDIEDVGLADAVDPGP